ncbi:MAG TPA: hypothetical protein DDX54_01780 [Rhodospirillaceae bacterium]|jgi:hypothetical protein|nr:hypothetical protein [Alphaproteobacteria bacterium]HBH26117.1 hypothetical protein [Rhodospirillaceae bacterium]
MNIDLLITAQGLAGLVAGANLPRKVVGMLFEPATGTLSLEMMDAGALPLNIPVDEELRPALAGNYFPFVGAVKGGHIAQGYQAPLAVIGDAFHAQMAAAARPAAQPLTAFAAFMAGCVAGQPVHREDLADEDTRGCVLGAAAPATLQFAPHLAQQRALEAAPRGPIPHAPGLGLGGSGGGGGGYFVPPTDGSGEGR